MNRWKFFYLVAMISFFGGAMTLVFAGDEAAESEHAETPTETQTEAQDPVVSNAAIPQGCLVDAAALEDLKTQKAEIEAKRKEITAKEVELKAREQAVSDEIKKIAEARDEISKIDASRKKENDAKVGKLVETVESMSPKAASILLATLDETLAVATMARLSTPKLAKVMNVMDPSRSTKLSELLAGVVRSNKSAAKGGDKYDAKNNESASSRANDAAPASEGKGT